MPVAFVGVVVLAVLADVWLYRTRTGLALRAVGLDETSSRRLGMGTGRMVILAFVVCSVMASIAGFYLAAEVQIGSPIIGNYALESIAAAVLGGASLAGGRGSFVGTLLAALFLSADRQRPAAVPAADGVRGDDDRRADPARARALRGPELLARLRTQGRLTARTAKRRRQGPANPGGGRRRRPARAGPPRDR